MKIQGRLLVGIMFLMLWGRAAHAEDFPFACSVEGDSPLQAFKVEPCDCEERFVIHLTTREGYQSSMSVTMSEGDNGETFYLSGSAWNGIGTRKFILVAIPRGRPLQSWTDFRVRLVGFPPRLGDQMVKTKCKPVPE